MGDLKKDSSNREIQLFPNLNRITQKISSGGFSNSMAEKLNTEKMWGYKFILINLGDN